MATSTIVRREIRRLSLERDAIIRRLEILQRVLVKLEALDDEEKRGLEARKQGKA